MYRLLSILTVICLYTPLCIAQGDVEMNDSTSTYWDGGLSGDVTTYPLIIVSAGNYNRFYGEENPSFEYKVSGAELKGEPDIYCAATQTSPVGTYSVIVSKGSVTSYNVTYVNGALTVNPASLLVSVDNYQREEGEDNPIFILQYEGWMNNENEEVLLKKPTATTEATKESPPGVYPILVSGGQAENYVFQYVNGILTITQSSAIDDTVEQEKPFNVYNLQGAIVRQRTTMLEGLPRGVYIVSGRKMVR